MNANSPTAATVIISTYCGQRTALEKGLDFNHGTGARRQLLGSVHERPNGVRWRVVPDIASDNAVFEEGMITSDEPGLVSRGQIRNQDGKPDALCKGREE